MQQQLFRSVLFILMLSAAAPLHSLAQSDRYNVETIGEAGDTYEEAGNEFWNLYIRLLNTPKGVDEIKRLMDAGNLDVNEQNKIGRSLLGEAVIQNNPGAVQLLLEYGLDPDHKDTLRGFAPLHEAALRGYTACAELLISKNAYINIADSTGAISLHLACGNGYYEFVDLLLKNNANVNALDKDELRPLHAAVLYGDPRITGLLVKAGAEIEARLKGSWDLVGGMTALHIAAADGNLAICKILLDAGADVNAVDEDVKTPLNYAYEGEHANVVKFLTAAGGKY